MVLWELGHSDLLFCIRYTLVSFVYTFLRDMEFATIERSMAVTQRSELRDVNLDR